MNSRILHFSQFRPGLCILMLSLLWCSACKEHGYEREKKDPAIHDLGAVKELLLPMQHIRSRAMLTRFDERGWSTMSTRCTHDGCDLSFEENSFLCPCCRSVFGLDGHVEKDPADRPLPWFEMSYADGHLYADAGKKVDEQYRYALPELMEAVRKYRQKALEKGMPDVRNVPKALLGEPDYTKGPMFSDGTKDKLYEAQMGIHRSPGSTRR